ncbi:MAG: (deoxy)nucleoside triphosphate pyrophosphohydrolase [Candidatus Eisenbacteria bacterium]|uniref:8-oxo-dGTP diphosphatase n=1 Tax=Eiseniibacteriota bacterium TaxID=2212470 RepID=A0A956LX30_UNCEI|nr:(deoxy)nucleoside triphosphate pyrophosphohydrolase [Candidatus Eisenbacteria bacterium]
MTESAPIRVAVAVVVRRSSRGGDRILISHRMPTGHLPDSWEFPGGKVEPGEASADCASREVLEETGVHIRVRGLLTRQSHAYPDRRVEIDFHACDYLHGIPAPRQCRAVRWVHPEHLCVYSFPGANREVLALLEERGWIGAR